MSKGEPYEWIISGDYHNDISDSGNCFYRLYTCHDFLALLDRLRKMFIDYGSLGKYLERHVPADKHNPAKKLTGLESVEAITKYFSSTEANKIVPKNTNSACKRICMFLRWMVRDNSPVDIGLWSRFIDKRTLIMPMDTHVVQQSVSLGLLSSKSSSMVAALKLTATMKTVFPEDPLRGDFAIFGYGVSGGN